MVAAKSMEEKRIEKRRSERAKRARLTRDADSRYGERAKRARLTRDADSRCTLAGGPQPLSIFVVMLQCVSRRELQPLLLFAADLLLP